MYPRKGEVCTHGFILCECVCVYMCVYVCTNVCKLIAHIHSTEHMIIQKELCKTERYVHVSKTECNIQGD